MPTLALGATQGEELTIAFDGNSYIVKGHPSVNERRNENRTLAHKDSAVLSLFFRTDSTGTIDTKLVARGRGSVRATVCGRNYTTKVDASDFESIKSISFANKTKGYQRVDFQVTQGQVEFLALQVSGAVSRETLSYVHDFSTYWGSRGPSVHLKYTMPKEPCKWFYNEVTVPVGNDVIGSYYMANGFGEGYFGIQCNSPSERRVLFSVWSPFTTDDPKSIPDSMKIVKLRQGKDVHIGEFGNEGSGGQSFLRFNWVAGNTYRFLASVEPDGKGSTIYTAYFFAPEEGKWRLIASFSRPKTDTHYKNAHSFLENFSPSQGYITRQVQFGNQWVCSPDGRWSELTQATFTYDATAAAGVRKDYAGGEKDGKFYLKNCGFFDLNTQYRSKSERTPQGIAPKIDFSALEKL